MFKFFARFSRIELISICILFFGHLVAAYTSYGYHHPDEHYQIFEWTNYFLGLSSDTRHMAWEYGAQIRPWFQPLLHALLIKPFLAIGLYNPFTAAFLLRFVYGLANVVAFVSLWQFFKNRYSLKPEWFLWISMLWFLPYIHVRTSSENLASIFISFAFLALLKRNRFFLSGFYFGIAFLARYQIALGLVGLAIALVLQERRIVRKHWALLAGFFAPLIVGVFLDRLGYGSWVFTPYRYFKVNLIDGVAATFNPYPWYQYFIWIIQLNPITSIPLFVGSFWCFSKKAKPEDCRTLGSFVATFFILHCFITNKEYRFLFPILNLIPFMATIGFHDWPKLNAALSKVRYIVPYAAMSVIAFAISSLHGASVQTLGAVYLAHHNLDASRPVFSNRDYPIQSPYYRFPVHEFGLVSGGDDLSTKLANANNAQVLIDGRLNDELTQGLIRAVNKKGCRFQDGALPRFIYQAQFEFVKRTPYIAWYDCSNRSK